LILAWLYLLLAGAFEWGWPVGLKLGMSGSGLRWGWIAFAVVCMAASGTLLLMAQRVIPIGTAYAVWTGIGAVGTFLIGILVFQEAAGAARFFFVGLIVVGILGLKLSSAH
jgi:quaternary ammonium compound-resistance protein SugE